MMLRRIGNAIICFYRENEANKIASNLTNWIVNDFKGD